MADDDVAVSHLPVAVVVQEAHELWVLLQRDGGAVGDRLQATGMAAAEGRYSCRDDPALAAQFASDYRRTHRRRRRASA